MNAKNTIEKNYVLKVNGKQVNVESARVSAYPFNRRWPGRQRSVDQTELMKFYRFDIDKPTKISIAPDFKFENVTIRPKSKGIKFEIVKGIVEFTLSEPVYCSVEFDDWHEPLIIFAEAPKNYGIKNTDENVLYFGKGYHDAGEIELKSNQTLYIDEGAVVYARVKAIDADNIKILGRGILDNSKFKEEIFRETECGDGLSDVCNAKREHAVTLNFCNNVIIDGIILRDSLVYNICPIGCNNLTIKNVKILGCWRYNSDGIDMHNCNDVKIEDCFIRTYDDSVCVKGSIYHEGFYETTSREGLVRNGKTYFTCSRISVKRCVIWNDWNKCLEIGAETAADEMNDIVFEDCDIIHVTGPIIDINNCHWADVHDIKYKNIRIECDKGFPLSMIQQSDDAQYPDENNIMYAPNLVRFDIEHHFEYSKNTMERGRVHDITIEDIYIDTVEPFTVGFYGFDNAHLVEKVNMNKIFMNGKKVENDSAFVLEHNEFVKDIRLNGKILK